MNGRDSFSSKIMITGGAGFIGSHLADYLSKQSEEILVIDDLSSGTFDNIAPLLSRRGFSFVQKDVGEVADTEMRDVETIIHLAANPDVRQSGKDPTSFLRGNIECTFSLLENAKRSSSIRKFILASTSSIYGESRSSSVTEQFGPLEPFSVYAATKLGCEALVSAYAHTYGFDALILRFGNIVGPRMRTGVIHDFIVKLSKNPAHLEIWGSGNQAKTYLYITDLVGALTLSMKGGTKGVDFYNICSGQELSVLQVANIVAEEMGLRGVALRPDGANSQVVGFDGDLMREVPDNSKLLGLGWRQTYTSAEAVSLTTRELLSKMLPEVKHELLVRDTTPQ